MKLPTIKLPKKITPCPILEAVVELRFDPNVEEGVVAGLVFSQMKQKFPKLERLPLAELPATIRESDPNLIYGALHRFSNDDFRFQVGPRAFSLVCPKEYKGWTRFSAEIESAFKVISDLGVVKKPQRIGVRYISFFSGLNIFDGIKLDLSLASNPLASEKNVLRTEFALDGFRQVLQLANSAMLNKSTEGSTVDIDIVFEGNNFSLTDFMPKVREAHDAQKRLFFGILKEDFLKNYNPEY